MSKTKKQDEENLELGKPICDECGNLKVLEGEDWLCPHCQGEIDFLGGEEDE
ncbi:MAG: hypothetical protein PHT36_02870 [Patescibacteria group bacterium]|nr:hypothetical protein [Patescibacteria group bacterium]